MSFECTTVQVKKCQTTETAAHHCKNLLTQNLLIFVIEYIKSCYEIIQNKIQIRTHIQDVHKYLQICITSVHSDMK